MNYKNMTLARSLTIFLILASASLMLAGCAGDSAETKKHFSGIRIAFFAGGPEGGNFATLVYNGARAAEQDLGCTIEFVWSQWKADIMVLQFKEMIDKKPDGICVMGHPTDDILGPLIDEARRKGIIVTTQNIDLPLSRAKYTKDGFGYVGQFLYESGEMLGKGLLRKFSFKPGDEAIVLTRDLADGTPYMRTAGLTDALNAGGLKIKIRQNPYPEEEQEQLIFDLVKEYPEVKLIAAGGSDAPGILATALSKVTDNPGDIIGAGFDLSPKTIQGIQDGYIGMVHDQQPYLQGYLPVLQVCLSKLYRFGGVVVNTGSGLVDASNIDVIADLVKRKIR